MLKKEQVGHKELVGGGVTNLHFHLCAGCFPVNFVVFTAINTNPSILLGYGTWVKLIGIFGIYAWRRTA